MKYLGIDYGTKRIGVAVSDETATLAFPLGTVKAGEGAVREVLDIIRENEVGKVIIGESRNFQGEANPVMQYIEVFKKKLEDSEIDVELEPEFMSSTLAARQFAPEEKSRKENPAHDNLDASAAALILQNYLDKLKK